ncbi:MAG: hypothetical protein K0B01_09505 [Syntrophobacterales bacterium]|nr:hypothetical protein [Syntrophobacterales bacterium]
MREICGCAFKEEEGRQQKPVEIPGKLFHKSTSVVYPAVLCPACKKDYGILSRMGLGT